MKTIGTDRMSCSGETSPDHEIALLIAAIADRRARPQSSDMPCAQSLPEHPADHILAALNQDVEAKANAAARSEIDQLIGQIVGEPMVPVEAECEAPDSEATATEPADLEPSEAGLADAELVDAEPAWAAPAPAELPCQMASPEAELTEPVPYPEPVPIPSWMEPPVESCQGEACFEEDASLAEKMPVPATRPRRLAYLLAGVPIALIGGIALLGDSLGGQQVTGLSQISADPILPVTEPVTESVAATTTDASFIEAAFTAPSPRPVASVSQPLPTPEAADEVIPVLLASAPSTKPDWIAVSPEALLRQRIPETRLPGTIRSGSLGALVNGIATGAGPDFPLPERVALSNEAERFLQEGEDGQSYDLLAANGAEMRLILGATRAAQRQYRMSRATDMQPLPNGLVLESGWLVAERELALTDSPGGGAEIAERTVPLSGLLNYVATYRPAEAPFWYLIAEDGVGTGFVVSDDVTPAGQTPRALGDPFASKNMTWVEETVLVQTRCRQGFVGPGEGVLHPWSVCQNPLGAWIDAETGRIAPDPEDVRRAGAIPAEPIHNYKVRQVVVPR